jgi:hypothetical protein
VAVSTSFIYLKHHIGWRAGECGKVQDSLGIPLTK